MTLTTDIAQRLTRDFELRIKGDWLQAGKCPSCGQRELFTRADNPWVIRCGRENKCGWEGKARDLYPDLFEGYAKRFKPTEANPNATADAYLQFNRGFDLARIRGWYEQGSFHLSDKDVGTPTVRFFIGTGSDGKPVHWERFIDNVDKIGRKAHFQGKHGGLWWTPPGQDLSGVEELYLVEGIFDAIALYLHGVPVAATLSSNKYPDISMAALKARLNGHSPRLVWALDGDQAGREATRKHIERARAEGWDCDAAQIPQHGRKKIDWNDLHIQSRLSDKDLEEYRYHGALLIAETPIAKALLMYQHREWREFHFEHGHRMYWFRLDLEKYNKAYQHIIDADTGMTEQEMREQALKECGSIQSIANCHPQALYYQANAVTDESWYYFRVTVPGKRDNTATIQNTFTGTQLAGAGEFKKRLLSIAPGAVWTGTTQQLDRIVEQQCHEIKVVDTVDFVGYSDAHACYIYNDVAVKDGRLYGLNDEDFFEIDRLSIKTLSRSVSLKINTDRHQYRTAWIGQLWRAFGPKGMVALAFWFGSLFGRKDYEGFDPSKSTLAARARNFAQVSNLPIVLIEADRDEDSAKKGRFDWDELKTAYNGRSVRSRGHKTSGNETYEPPFRGTIVISQNAEVNASEAILQRIVHLRFDRSGHNEQTRGLADALARTQVEDVSGFLLAAITREKQVLETVADKSREFEKALLGLPEIKTVRIAKNHAQLIGLLHALAGVINLPEGALQQTEDCLVELAIERQRAIAADHPLVQDFWEVYDYLDGDRELNHARDPERLVAVNLNHFVKLATDKRQQIPPLIDLKRHLKSCRHPKFDAIRAVNSALWNDRDTLGGDKDKVVKCWVFQREGR